MFETVTTKVNAAESVIPLADGRELSLARPLVMGVLNVTPDSFSDGGRFAEPALAAEHALRMVHDSADIIDIGGESTRPGAEPVPVEQEIERVIPVITAIRRETDVPISIDTYKAKTAKAALEAGADIVNDVSALRFDPEMVRVVADHKVPLVLMHMLGSPRDMQKDPRYDDCIKEVSEFLDERAEFAVAHGVARSRIIVDPGLGFGKRLEDNIVILRDLKRFRSLGRPVLVGASRKSFISKLHPSDEPADRRLGGSLAAMTLAVLNGANIIRVHDVDQTVEALKVLEAVKEDR